MQLRDYRKLKGITQQDVADLMGFSRASTVHRHEIGANRPSIDVIDRYRQITDGAVNFEDWQKLQRKKLAA